MTKKFKVLFCGPEFNSGYNFTAEALAATNTDIIAVQCQTREEIHQQIVDADVIVPLMTPIDAKVLNAAKQLKLIIQFGAGIEGIDIDTATAQGIWCSNIPTHDTGNALSCAEHAIFLTLAVLRNPYLLAESIRNQQLGTPTGSTLHGKTVLILGFGGIAKNLILRLAPFGAVITCLRRQNHWNRESSDTDSDSRAAEHLLSDKGVWATDTPRLASNADIVIVTCHQDSENKGMVNREFFRYCKPGVKVINVARGGLIDYESLKEGLESGHVGAAGLDVQWQEPIDPNDWMCHHPRVYLTPHIAGVTNESYRNMAAIIAREAELILNGHRPTVQLNCPPENIRRIA